ncbi:putative Mitogen-activated protein kinase kinase kinase A [Hypsibius exemplaris]|uniref:Mitogen-activated protein kinase kinase kinase A n=1 Tax=Hypsibius exemplaris TaxID=2072580 RepID=A0A1W0X1L5_HYPEX|nr:putative Mitogen-activated protein kinase kinase kinase A [Hypsibius exemplaris]
MVEIGKGYSDIFFKDSFGFDSICRPTADNSYIGQGAFGYVVQVNGFYLDSDPVSREGHAETYALKILYGHAAQGDGRTEELEILLHLQHDHVIRYFAVGTTICRNEYCVLMEFCSGKTLTEFIKSNKMHCSTNVIVIYTTQIASGLDYLHEEIPTKIIHGGLRSENILMKDFTGQILKIAALDGSFQRKAVPRSSEKQMEAQGTFCFMSPEMIAWEFDNNEGTQRPPDSSTDIWSLGCVILDMYLAREGQPDLRFNEGQTDSYAIAQHIRKGLPIIPQIPEDMPEELKVLAGRCLKVIPGERPTAATLVRYAHREYFAAKCLVNERIEGPSNHLTIAGRLFEGIFNSIFIDAQKTQYLLLLYIGEKSRGAKSRFAEHDEDDGHRHSVHVRRGNPITAPYSSCFTLFLHLSLLLLFLGLSLLSSLTYTEPVYNLQQSLKYPHQYLTRNLDVRFYLKDDIHTKLTNKERLTIETSVEELYLNNLKESCVRERAYKENVMWRGRLYSDHKPVQIDWKLETPSCDTLSLAYNKLASV